MEISTPTTNLEARDLGRCISSVHWESVQIHRPKGRKIAKNLQAQWILDTEKGPMLKMQPPKLLMNRSHNKKIHPHLYPTGWHHTDQRTDLGPRGSLGALKDFRFSRVLGFSGILGPIQNHTSKTEYPRGTSGAPLGGTPGYPRVPRGYPRGTPGVPQGYPRVIPGYTGARRGTARGLLDATAPREC